MKKNIYAMLFLLLLATPAAASELTGRISTDQNELNEINEEVGIKKTATNS